MASPLSLFLILIIFNGNGLDFGFQIDKLFWYAVIGAPVVEEWLFRGNITFLSWVAIAKPRTLFPSLIILILNPWRIVPENYRIGFLAGIVAVVPQAIGFALCHIPTDEGFYLIPFLIRTGSGVLNGISTLRCRKIAPSTIAHSLWNLFCFMGRN